MINIIGLSAYFHDSSCCLLQDGKLVAAVQEERFTRIKHDASLPLRAFEYCLSQAGLDITGIDRIAYYENPRKKLQRQLWMSLPDASQEQMTRLWRRARQPMQDIRDLLGWEGPIDVMDHHESHAASSFYFSGFPEAAIMTVDGVGEWATTTYGHGAGPDLNLIGEVSFPDSLGLFYSVITSYLGFSVNDGEYKVMGLAPYGDPSYLKLLEQLITCEADGQYRLTPMYFNFADKQRMYTGALTDLLGIPPREPQEQMDRRHFDLARSAQYLLEQVLLEKAKWLYSRVPSPNLCLAGGVALNCVANSRILREGPFDHVFVQPAAGDAGTALGAAALAHVRVTNQHPCTRRLRHVYLGPCFDTAHIARLLEGMGIDAIDFQGCEEQLLEAVVDRLSEGKVIGWFYGRMEFGPRSLGARSILADPRNPQIRDHINKMVKRRESFRPFAPAVLEEAMAEHFDLDHPSPFMLETCQVISTLNLPAITHVDGSARVQSVDRETNPRFARLLERFGERTRCPMLLNTSFNVRDEPIVCSPMDAIRCFGDSMLDAIVLEDFLIDRTGITNESLKEVLNQSKPLRPHGLERVYTFN